MSSKKNACLVLLIACRSGPLLVVALLQFSLVNLLRLLQV